MSYATITAHCYQCGALFTPVVDQVVFCRTCVEDANPQRIADGLTPISTAGCYDAQEVA